MTPFEITQRIADHQRRGRYVQVGDVRWFTRDEAPVVPQDGASAETVLLIHGVPVSGYLWRRVLDPLAAAGLRAVAPDLPGLGLSDRPPFEDYTWSGLGEALARFVDAAGLDRVHLVVHDIGGPVGFEFAHLHPDRVASITILNTVVAAEGFRRPWSMEPFARPLLRRLWLAGAATPAFGAVLRLHGIGDITRADRDDIAVHQALLRRGDGGEAFLKIMAGFERTASAEARYNAAVANPAYPRQVVWSVRDPALRWNHEGRIAVDRAKPERVIELAGRHFPQEDRAEDLAAHIAEFVHAHR